MIELLLSLFIEGVASAHLIFLCLLLKDPAELTVCIVCADVERNDGRDQMRRHESVTLAHGVVGESDAV